MKRPQHLMLATLLGVGVTGLALGQISNGATASRLTTSGISVIQTDSNSETVSYRGKLNLTNNQPNELMWLRKLDCPACVELRYDLTDCNSLSNKNSCMIPIEFTTVKDSAITSIPLTLQYQALNHHEEQSSSLQVALNTFSPLKVIDKHQEARLEVLDGKGTIILQATLAGELKLQTMRLASGLAEGVSHCDILTAGSSCQVTFNFPPNFTAEMEDSLLVNYLDHSGVAQEVALPVTIAQGSSDGARMVADLVSGSLATGCAVAAYYTYRHRAALQAWWHQKFLPTPRHFSVGTPGAPRGSSAAGNLAAVAPVSAPLPQRSPQSAGNRAVSPVPRAPVQRQEDTDQRLIESVERLQQGSRETPSTVGVAPRGRSPGVSPIPRPVLEVVRQPATPPRSAALEPSVLFGGFTPEANRGSQPTDVTAFGDFTPVTPCPARAPEASVVLGGFTPEATRTPNPNEATVAFDAFTPEANRVPNLTETSVAFSDFTPGAQTQVQRTGAPAILEVVTQEANRAPNPTDATVALGNFTQLGTSRGSSPGFDGFTPEKQPSSQPGPNGNLGNDKNTGLKGIVRKFFGLGKK